ncbi:hypothetical protein [Methanosphaerula palustris]|uniref:Uncharacterized protein n=1 Tax=Methanosphaerula palustris (strain ATCC BAA-1556 / DSM 19958 / E1-9c) TaxID=521011 RepID=B8GG83_METPE|nr:hypothetical protein [Methanosphaerula palustris]ACL16157.1 conserved hypothetical protein [Methanosphaerula palustris E1-9c]
MELVDTLRTFLESGDDWERKQTSVPGLSIIKLPKTRTRPASLALELNPVGENGLPMKRKGYMVMNTTELAALRSLVTNEKVDSLFTAITEVMPEKRSVRAVSDSILEI